MPLSFCSKCKSQCVVCVDKRCLACLLREVLYESGKLSASFIDHTIPQGRGMISVEMMAVLLLGNSRNVVRWMTSGDPLWQGQRIPDHCTGTWYLDVHQFITAIETNMLYDSQREVQPAEDKTDPAVFISDVVDWLAGDKVKGVENAMLLGLSRKQARGLTREFPRRFVPKLGGHRIFLSKDILDFLGR